MNRFCRKTGVAIIPWSPFATGSLARPLSTIMSTTRAGLDSDKLSAHASRSADAEIITRVEELAKKKGWTMAQVAFTWCMGEVTAPIIGVSSLDRLNDYTAAMDFELSKEEKKYLEEPYQPKEVEGFNMDRTTS